MMGPPYSMEINNLKVVWELGNEYPIIYLKNTN
jgi:hypothetical protein